KCTSALWWWVELLLLVLIGWVGGQFPLFVFITRERCDGVCACLFFLYICSVGRVNLRARWCARAVGSIFICFWNEFGAGSLYRKSFPRDDVKVPVFQVVFGRCSLG
ncbi:unnamed protein product, partial [Pylaiella littoralis]